MNPMWGQTHTPLSWSERESTLSDRKGITLYGYTVSSIILYDTASNIHSIRQDTYSLHERGVWGNEPCECPHFTVGQNVPTNVPPQ